MLNPDLIDDGTLHDILENMPDGWSDENKLVNLEISSFNEAFERFMEWNGICGFNSMIKRAIFSLLAAEVPFGHTELRTMDPESAISTLNEGEVLIITRLSTGEIFARKGDQYDN